MPAKDGQPEVLLVDDTVEAGALERTLESAGCALQRVSDVAGAEAALGGSRPDLILIGLETEGALGLCDLIRALPRGGTAAILLVGGPEEDVHSAADAILRGADAYLSRPVGADELLRKVESLVGPIRRPAADGAGGAAGDVLDHEAPTHEPTQVLPDPSEAPTAAVDLRELDVPLEAPAFDATAETELRPGEDLDAEARIASDDGSVGGGSAPSPFGSSRGLASPPSELGPLDPSLIDDEDLLNAEELPLSGWTGEHLLTASRSPAPDADPPRPEATHVLADKQGMPRSPFVASLPRLPALEGTRGPPGADAELSDEFRRVIDEVAQRLFPEASPDEYEEEAFDELQTIVPAVADPRVPIYEGIDDFSLDSMETFPGADGGLTLGLFEEPTTAREGDGDVTDEEAQTGAEPTKPHEKEPPLAEPAAGRSASPAPPVTEADEPVPIVRIGERAVGHGTLAEHPFPVLLAACIECRVRARLVVRRGRERGREARAAAPEERVIVLDAGQPVLASSTVPSDRLIEMLRLQGRLTAAQHDQCRSLVQTSRRRPGAVLVELGIARPDELLPLVRWHFAEIVLACFTWRRGTFRLEPLSPAWSSRISIDQSGPTLLLEGLRRRYGVEKLAQLLGGWESRPRSRLAKDAALPDGLLASEAALPSLCDGRRRLDEVVAESGLDRTQGLAALYGLTLLGHLEPPGEEPLPRLATEASERAVDRALLVERIAQVREADYFSLLGVSPDASNYEVRRAHERRMVELAPERLHSIGAADLSAELADARYVMNEALEILTDDELRQAYRLNRFGRPPE